MPSKFNIGDEVWRASWQTRDRWLTCPDCGGTRSMTVTLWDRTQHVIPCAGCAAGYNPPSGLVHSYEYSVDAKPETVMGLEMCGDNYEYKTSGSCCVYERDLSATKEEALVRAAELTAERQRQEEAKIYQKEKPARTWSWHVHYHRRQIKEAQKALDYHTAKLNAATAKAKEPESV